MITRAQYLSGKVRRWHTHHDLSQTNADHSWGVATILLKITNPSLPLLKAALWHDVGEYLVGDVPGFAKAENKELKSQCELSEIDARYKLNMLIPPLDEAEKKWLELADALEAWLFIKYCGRFSEAEIMEYFPAILAKMRTAAEDLSLDLSAVLGEVVR